MAEYNLHVEFKHKDSLVEFSMHSALIPFLIKYTSFSLLCRHCFTAVSVSVSVCVSVSVRSHSKAPPARFFLGVHQNMIQLYRDHFPLKTLTFRVKIKPVEVIM